MSFDGIVIGGGPAGMFAAITASQAGQKVLLLVFACSFSLSAVFRNRAAICSNPSFLALDA